MRIHRSRLCIINLRIYFSYKDAIQLSQATFQEIADFVEGQLHRKYLTLEQWKKGDGLMAAETTKWSPERAIAHLRL